MNDKINLKIKDFGPINETDIDMGKITVIGGPNATGKSTASKLLYCYLRANFEGREDFALKELKSKINMFLGMIYHKLGIEEPEYVNFDEVAPLEKRKSDSIVPYDELELHQKYYQAQLDFYKNYDENNPLNKSIEEDIKELDDLLTKILINENNELPVLLLRSLLPIEFDNLSSFYSSFNGIKNNEEFDFSINLNKNNLYDENTISAKGHYEFNEVLYIDSFPFFDTLHPPRNITHHVGYLKEMFKRDNSKNLDFFNEKINKTKIKIVNSISDVIGGGFQFENSRLIFNSSNNDQISIQNTSSGIKQIALILYLLDNQILKDDCFLILDEPEVNLHPKWQFEFANILVLLAKELNIKIYINSHSPMFIESIDAFSEFYDMEDDVTYYLAEESINIGKYDFVRINSNELYKIYDNLGNPYRLIDQLRLRKKLGE